jgi:hypothetical protein
MNLKEIDKNELSNLIQKAIYRKKLIRLIQLLYHLSIEYIDLLDFTGICKEVFEIEHKTIEEIVIDLELVIITEHIVIDRNWIFEKYVKISTT